MTLLALMDGGSDPVIRLTALFAALTEIVQAVIVILLVFAVVCLPFSRQRSIEVLKFAGLIVAIWIFGPVILGAVIKLLALALSPWLVALGVLASLVAYWIRQRQKRPLAK